ncbi:ATP-binding protein [Paenibacillus sp. GCM10023252]|uniref:ATP-binding protein n=1 Tax=Paenibacillus sp. GCM10023252 TaxID=3252649 RepID=UPI00360C4615
MLIDLLLQTILSLIPMFAFQLWFDRSPRARSIPIFMGLMCGLAMILCMAAAPSSEFNMDYRLIPYLIGALYGGLPSLILLTAIYVGYRMPAMDHPTELIILFIFVAVMFTVLHMSTRHFQQANRARKQRMALLLFSVTVLFYLLSVVYATARGDMIWDGPLITSVVLGITGAYGIVWLFIFTLESVIEKQQLQQKLEYLTVRYRDEVDKLQQFIDETTFGVVIVDVEGQVTQINRMAMELFKLKGSRMSSQDWVGQPFHEMIDREQYEMCVQLIVQALLGNNKKSELWIADEKIYLRTAFSIRNVDNKVTGAALTAYDITELSQLRDEVGKMERLSLVGQMAASITHEIRNPMAVIRGFVQLMQERSPDNQREYFRIVMDELDRANSIINDFLSLAQNRVVEMKELSLHHILNDLYPLMLADANMRGQSIELGLCEHMPTYSFNEKEMKQLILNLARNGMEAMGDKGVLRIHTDVKDGHIELRVMDDGVGISKEQMRSLFEPFFTTKTRGTGLGLPLCLSIVERHGGKIEVESVQGEGTIFVVTFAKLAS